MSKQLLVIKVGLLYKQVTLTQLSDLKGISEADFCGVFLDNLNFVYQYGNSDVQNSIEAREMDTLMKLRGTLSDRVQAKLPEYAGRTMM